MPTYKPESVVPTPPSHYELPKVDDNFNKAKFDKVFAKSCSQPFGNTDACQKKESIKNSFNPWGLFISSAEAMPLAIPPPVVSSSATMAAGTQNQSNNDKAARALTQVAGKFKDKSLDNLRFVVEASPVINFSLMLFKALQFPDDTQHTEEELRQMQEVKSRIRVQIIEPEGDDVYPTVRAFHVGDGDDKVPVRYVGQNAQGQYSVALEEGGPTIYWSPDETGNQVPHTTPSQDDGVSFDDIWVNPLSDAVNDSSTVLPMPAESDWQDRILVFPEGSGIEPLYLVFKTTARNEPGVVTGKGEDITGIWLEKAGQGLGAPIPSQIADKLRGREFSSFDVFRKAFWVEVSKDEFLMSQFNKQNQNRILLGKSPKTRSIDKVGKRNSFEIHHIEEIQYGGEVYNVDNLRIVTAKNHIRIHKNEI